MYLSLSLSHVFFFFLFFLVGPKRVWSRARQRVIPKIKNDINFKNIF